MKNIKLTKEHEFKLLKMCKLLFPEVKIHTGILSNGSQAPEKVLDYPVDLEWGTEWDLPYISVGTEEIHWFEFCLIHLSKKLNLDYDDGPMIFSILIQNNHEHLIDYLYEIFKKNEKS